MDRIQQLNRLGQSIWFDFIRRSFLADGRLEALVAEGVRGVTSNPAIFEKAIAGSTDYDDALAPLAEAGRSVEEIYETLVVEDIRVAADQLRGVYDATGAEDGYVSLEVNPRLAHDTANTVAEARRLFALLDRPNIMIKVPATPAGVPAVETLIDEGVNVNVTLIFSRAQYEAVARAYLAGLARRVDRGADPSRVASVASFFVSRVDTAVDAALAEPEGRVLAGKIAVDNARLAYARFLELFSGDHWARLAAAGARVQRPLWASTGTKNPAYPDTLYVDELVGPHTVNTVPPATLEAFRDHGRATATLGDDLDGARERVARLPALGVDLDAVTEKLQDDGVQAFVTAFDGLLASITEKRDRLVAR